MNMARLESQASMEQEKLLIRKKGLVNGRERIALIDCGANHILIRPGIVDDPGTEHFASVESFDGHIRLNLRLRAVHATVEMDGMKFDSIALTEYRLPVTHDLILGKRWLTRFNPAIDWQTNVITVSSMKVFDTMYDRANDCDLPWDGNSDNHLATQAIQYDIYHVTVTAIDDQKDESPEVESLLDEYLHAVEAHDEYFQQRPDATEKLGLSAMQKCIVANRQLAYGMPADAVDEYVRHLRVYRCRCSGNSSPSFPRSPASSAHCP
ncbi:hypothetical protein PsorP6_003092 [Peronosclerospora sorghi]|uniref:Uncharacterized protein n=1 Tax=Peronosclerospora sorghi TaxID=230839 RepID=A0ACC0VKR9_9STRA|nr:hypothetical protein PsorP6_003092 [Peronosclerospora sorghi]